MYPDEIHQRGCRPPKCRGWICPTDYGLLIASPHVDLLDTDNRHGVKRYADAVGAENIVAGEPEPFKALDEVVARL